MIISARLSGLDGLAARLAQRLPAARVAAALDAAAATLAHAAAANLGHAPTIQATADARMVGSTAPAAVARETGTLTTPPDPWLAPAVAALKTGGGHPPGGGENAAAPRFGHAGAPS